MVDFQKFLYVYFIRVENLNLNVKYDTISTKIIIYIMSLKLVKILNIYNL